MLDGGRAVNSGRGKPKRDRRPTRGKIMRRRTAHLRSIVPRQRVYNNILLPRNEASIFESQYIYKHKNLG